MLKILARIGCLTVILLIAFVFVALWGGGDFFRKVGETTGGYIQKGAETLAEKADEIKGKADRTKGKVRDWRKEKALEDK
ncbi:MAG TPA: hypothetical protein VLD40_00765 [Dissulfurispiraceae bacterium]|nr:hypothetical protein [Dissulfurispiraceae bacterium]